MSPGSAAVVLEKLNGAVSPTRCPPKSKEAGKASNSVDIHSVAAKQTAAVRTSTVGASLRYL